jgi:hypothetical protein
LIAEEPYVIESERIDAVVCQDGLYFLVSELNWLRRDELHFVAVAGLGDLKRDGEKFIVN